jgi:hypothetical protein
VGTAYSRRRPSPRRMAAKKHKVPPSDWRESPGRP